MPATGLPPHVPPASEPANSQMGYPFSQMHGGPAPAGYTRVCGCPTVMRVLLPERDQTAGTLGGVDVDLDAAVADVAHTERSSARTHNGSPGQGRYAATCGKRIVQPHAHLGQQQSRPTALSTCAPTPHPRMRLRHFRGSKSPLSAYCCRLKCSTA